MEYMDFIVEKVSNVAVEGLSEQRKYQSQRESKKSSGQVVIVLIKYLYTVALV
jgi:hypothetical protein